MLGDRGDLIRVSQVRLLDHENDILLPLVTDQTQEIPRRTPPRVRYRKNEHDQVGHWNKIFRNILMICDDRVCSRGIDNVEVFQKINRPVTGSYVLGYLDVVFVVAVLKDVNAI